MGAIELSLTKIKATRKIHQCAWCGETIQVGSKAQLWSYVWEDGPKSDWLHPECWDVMEDLPDDLDLSEGWMPGDFHRGSSQPK